MTTARRGWIAAHLAVVAAFLIAVASYYHAPYGFTELIRLPVDPHNDYELAAVRSVPHVEDQNGGYDGQFYARLALDPLLRDPAIDSTLDSPGYRARRIFFSWTACVLGLGRPAWVLEAFALQNVVVWLVFAWLLLRWLPIGSARSFALWSGCLLTHGMLSSVGNALLDAPSALLLAFAVVASESGRPWLTSIVLGISGLARETNLLGTVVLAKFLEPTPRSVLRAIGWTVVALIPALLWMDYMRSIYRQGAFATAGVVTTPLAGLVWKIGKIGLDFKATGMTTTVVFSACAVVAFLTQVVVIGRIAVATWRERSPWLMLAVAFGVLSLTSHSVVWAGTPGAITRVALPMALGFNVLARQVSWPVLVLGNLGVVPGVLSFMFRM
ncbi:MAG TPA: hypothetical protein VJN96_17560 [Vicinamibacterales bacterium]|nr:hypothetical protein [Vicinamibacterales bacterium]